MVKEWPCFDRVRVCEIASDTYITDRQKFTEIHTISSEPHKNPSYFQSSAPAWCHALNFNFIDVLSLDINVSESASDLAVFTEAAAINSYSCIANTRAC